MAAKGSSQVRVSLCGVVISEQLKLDCGASEAGRQLLYPLSGAYFFARFVLCDSKYPAT